MPSDLLLCYYGDDFTGSTDALEFLARAGAKTMLFMTPPTKEQLSKYPGLQAVGVAGMTRSMGLAQMTETLTPAFEALRALGAPHVHYKVCSTFDSSPEIGSIGCAIDLGAKIFGARFVPLLVGAPALGRYCLFGNLFARFGGEGQISRLDRHPSISQHPVTPMNESDLRLHLAEQTEKAIGLFDILKVELPYANGQVELARILNLGAQIVLFDVLNESNLETIARLIDDYAGPKKPLFSVGSSGVEMALGKLLGAEGKIQKKIKWPEPGAASPLLVLAGSCSPVSEEQIVWALEHGFAEVPLDVASVMAGKTVIMVGQAAADAAVDHLKAGRSVIVHTRKSAIAAREATAPQEVNRVKQFAKPEDFAHVWKFGIALSVAADAILKKTKTRRVCIAGGDTSGRIARTIGIEALEMIAPLAPGAPLCKAHAPDSPADGIELVLKGGQVGNKDFFGAVLRGKV